jgi:hypothetical protein
MVRQIIKEIIQDYKEILVLRILLDDNQDYMYIGFNNRSTWTEDKDIFLFSESLTDEDIIRFI